MHRQSLRLVLGACVIAGLCVRGDLAASPGPLADPVVNAADTTANDTQSTTTIVLGSGSNVITAFNNSALNNGTNFHMVGWSRSTNGGTTWTDGGALPSATGGDFGFPVLARDTTSGTVYLAAQPFAGTAAIQVFSSANDAQTWAAPVNAMPGFIGGDALSKPWVAVDNFPGTGKGNVYVVTRNVAGGGTGSKATGIYLSKSTNGGATFALSAFGVLSSTGAAGPNVVVGTDHAVYVFWWINLAGIPQIRFVKSTDFGVSFAPIAQVAVLTGTGGNGDLGLTFATNSFPQAAVNPVTGDIYVVYNDKAGVDKGDIFVSVSSDGGTSWNGPFTLNSDAAFGSTKDQFMPSITVTPDGKHGLISWYDRRSDPSNALIERWGVIATFAPGGNASISPNFRLSTGSWPVVIGQDNLVGSLYMGTYDGAAADNNFFYVAWGDNRLSDAAHTHQPDVRVAKIPVTGPAKYDLDRDFQSDRTVFRPSTGAWFSALSNGGATATGFGTTGDVDVLADYDGDGKVDLAVWRPSTGAWYITQSSNGVVRVDSWGTNGDIPLAGDVDGDGFADLVVWRPSNGAWFIKLSSGGSASFGFGTTGDQPLLGDYDGDGFADLTIFRNGAWYMFHPFDSSTSAVGWGTAGDVPVVGDWDGDGISDLAIFRSGAWWIKKSSGGTLVVGWGTGTDIPVSGDFDGDGKSDFNIWRPSTGAWFTQFAAGGSAAVGWGTVGDKPTGRLPGT